MILINIIVLMNNMIFSWIIFVITLVISSYIGLGSWIWEESVKIKALKAIKVVKLRTIILISIIGTIITSNYIHLYFLSNQEKYIDYLIYTYTIILWILSCILYRLRYNGII